MTATMTGGTGGHAAKRYVGVLQLELRRRGEEARQGEFPQLVKKSSKSQQPGPALSFIAFSRVWSPDWLLPLIPECRKKRIFTGEC
jgi:hypothetical protein